MKYTPWFEPETPPVREGVYQRYVPSMGAVMYSYWNGECWGVFEATPAMAYRYRDKRSWYFNLKWRGLLK